MARDRAEAPPRLVGVVLGDLLFGIIWGLAGVVMIQQVPVVGAVLLLMAAAIIGLGFAVLSRNSAVLMVGTVVNGLLAAWSVVSTILTLMQPAQVAGGMNASYNGGRIAGAILVIIIPLACAISCYKAWRYEQDKAAAARRRNLDGSDASVAAEDDFETGAGWDERAKR